MLTVQSMLLKREFLNKIWAEILAFAWLYFCIIFCWKASGIGIPTFYKYVNQSQNCLDYQKIPDTMDQADLMFWNQHDWKNQVKTSLILVSQIFSRLRNVSSQSISTHCVLYSVVIIPLLPVHRTIENFSVELSRADAATTALQLYILSSHHAQEILPRKLEYYLPVPCQIRHIDFDTCYSLCSSLFALCRSDSCWVMEFKVLVYISTEDFA